MRETYINDTPYNVICALYRTILRAPACRQNGRPLLGFGTSCSQPERLSVADSINSFPRSASIDSQWKQLYESAILELDSTKMPSRIAEARRAILDRAEETLSYPASDENRALNNALHGLRLLEAVFAGEKPAA
jgi:hypothetical protein